MTQPPSRAILGRLLVAVGLCLCLAVLACADDATAPSAEHLARLLADLNSDQFHVRRRAADGLQKLAEQPAAQSLLVETLHGLLLEPDTPYEVRAQCEPILLRLPAPADEPRAAVTAAEIAQLLVQADARSYGVRAGAALRLAWIAKHDPQSAGTIAENLKHRLADPALEADSRRRLSEIREVTWTNWLASDPATWPAPTATLPSIREWIETIASDASGHVRLEAAERELIDALVHENLTGKISALLAERLEAEDLSLPARERLTRLYELTRPAMAAEIWEDHQHGTVQYLLIGVPQYPERMTRATFFDKIDDTTAHCVSGNSLAPGDYPVGIAIPPTHTYHDIDKRGRMFQIVNLPTARRRLLYDHQHLKIDDWRRLREVSERTTAWLLARKECLMDREIEMLRQLDAQVVSRFVGPYLLAVDDKPKLEPDDFPTGGRTSRHAMLCALLAEVGTHEALPGLVEAAGRGRLPGPNEELRVHIGWLAALLIAERDPWPDLDDWLASLTENSQPLTSSSEQAPDVGATAAAMLVERHGAARSEFGIVEVNDSELRSLGISACRFQTPEGRQRVGAWWQRQKERIKAAGA